jgi:catalase-peroxidase
VLEYLEEIKREYQDDSLSFSDLIVFAADYALEVSGLHGLDFKSGRTDAEDGEGSLDLVPRDYYLSSEIAVRDKMKIQGLSPKHAVALAGRPRSLTRQLAKGYSGSWDNRESVVFDNMFFKTLLENEWIKLNEREFQSASDSKIYITAEDYALITDPDLLNIVEMFAKRERSFKRSFVRGWEDIMGADIFEPLGSRI